MLTLALKAQIPIIAARTNDTMNFPDIVRTLTGVVPVMLPPTQEIATKKVFFLNGWPKDAPPLNKFYEKLVQAQSSLVILNPAQIVEPMFDAGEVPVPKTMLIDLLRELCDDDDRATRLARTLGGCTIREAVELARLTMARDYSLTSNGLVESRKQAFLGQKGLAQVDPRQPLYVPASKLVSWVERERPFFLDDDVDARLVPRGLLFDGAPGTGKSAGAKWLASELGVPLYRLDVGTTKGKYVGESEGALAANLARLDREEPCIVLIDEIEKVFSTSDPSDGNTTSAMLGQLLWWLAEHRSRVLTIMTTNDRTKLPPELYREGRIDEVMWFEGLEFEEATAFVQQVLQTFEISPKVWALDALGQPVMDLIKATNPGDENPRVSQALLTKKAYEIIKTSSH